MNEKNITLDQVLTLARQLTPLEKVRLIEGVVPDLEGPLKIASEEVRESGILGSLIASPLS